MRYENEYRWTSNSDTPVPSEMRNVGRKLLGYLANQMRLSGVRTLHAQQIMADGSVVRAAFYDGQPRLDFEVAGGGGGTPAKNTLVQGFVAHPRTTGSATAFGAKPQVILDNNGSATPDEDVGYINLFYDDTYYPANPATQRSGLYTINRFNQVVLASELAHSGNVDWRNDAGFVIWWGGSSARYVNASSNADGRKACINGDIIVDFTSVSGITASYAIIGCCLQGTTLVVCVARDASGGTPSDIRVYTAPLVAKNDPLFLWLKAFPPVETPSYPRFEPVPAATWTLRFMETFPVSDETSVRGGHPMCFNQDATEGRMIARYNVGGSVDYPNSTVREWVLDIANLDEITLEVAVLDGSLYHDDNYARTGLEVVLGGYMDDLLNEFYPAANIAALYASGTVEATRSLQGRSSWIPWAVDYKDNVPVYAYRRGMSIQSGGSYTSNPTVNSVAAGDVMTSTNPISHTWVGSGANGGVKLPWIDPQTGQPKEILTNYSTNQVGTTAGSGSHDGTASTYSFDTTGTWADTTITERFVPFFMDLRTDTIIYGIHTERLDESLSYVWSFDNVLDRRKIVTTGYIDLTDTLRTVVHVGGADVADSGVVQVRYSSDTTHADQFTNIGISPPEGTYSSPRSVVFWCWHTTHSWTGGIGLGYLTAANSDDLVAQALIDQTPVVAPLAHPDVATAATSIVPSSDFATGWKTPRDLLYGTSKLMTWGTVSQTYYTGGSAILPSGAWCTDDDGNYVVCIAWPTTGGVQGWQNLINGEVTLDALTGENGATLHMPIWMTTSFCYEHKTRT